MTRTWVKLMTGLWGYRTQRKVSWKCVVLSITDVNTFNSKSTTVGEDIGGFKSVGTSFQFDDNFTVTGESSARKRTQESLEPRNEYKKMRLCYV